MKMTQSQERLNQLQHRLRILLPDNYEVVDREVKPISMGSAGLKYGPDGRVAWDKIWGSFCDLAMAGGPPHRGTLLEPYKKADVELCAANQELSGEICRGLTLVTGLYAEPTPFPGWLRLYCQSAAMSGWLARAVVMENVSALSNGLALELPSSPAFRLEKEVKNVITVVAKTCHYWRDHMSYEKHDDISRLLAEMNGERNLTYPSANLCYLDARRAELEEAFAPAVAESGFAAFLGGSSGWVGLDCWNIAAAIGMMRALCVSNFLSRREGTTVFFPAAAVFDDGPKAAQVILEAYRLHTVMASG